MAKKYGKILFDKTEIVINYYNGKNREDLNLPYNQITSFSIDKCKVKKFFKEIETERVGVTARPLGNTTIYYYANKEGEFFEGYKEGIRKFAKENGISLFDNLKEQDT